VEVLQASAVRALHVNPPSYGQNKKVKKGPRRIKKQVERVKAKATVQDLDLEMDEYRRAGKFGGG
jgi:hypothetical protein